jgi:hypothetical protein
MNGESTTCAEGSRVSSCKGPIYGVPLLGTYSRLRRRLHGVEIVNQAVDQASLVSVSASESESVFVFVRQQDADTNTETPKQMLSLPGPALPWNVCLSIHSVAKRPNRLPC